MLYPLYRKLSNLLGRAGLSRSVRLRRVHRRLRSKLTSGAVPVQGHQMLVDRIDTLEVTTDESYEPLETHVVANHVRPGDVALDLGAHIGYYTLLMARLVGPSGRVIAFEPARDNFELLERNVRLNGYTTVTCVNAAVSDREGTVRLHRSATNLGDHRIYPSDEERDTVEVRSVHLDLFLAEEAPRVDFVKMDIQGAELFALRGFTGTMARNPGIRIVAEFWPYGLRTSGTDPADVVSFFLDRGFSVYTIDEFRSSVDPVTDVERLVAHYTDETLREPGEKDYTTLLCLPPDVGIGLDGAPLGKG